jgi:hypothetical protein
MKFYYADQQNKTAGPVSQEELQRLIKEGIIKNDPMVVVEGRSDWKPLSSTNIQSSPAAGEMPAGSPPQVSQAAEKTAVACKDALEAFKLFVTDPVGGMPRAFEKLGTQRAVGAGLAFGGVSLVCLCFLIYKIFKIFGAGCTFDDFFKMLMVSAVPFASLLVVCMAGNKMLKGEGMFGHDCFIAGASLLPGAFLALLTAILGIGNLEVIIALGVVSVCLMVLMLFSGFTRIYKIKESLATIAVPVTLLICCWLSKVIYVAMFNHF